MREAKILRYTGPDQPALLLAQYAKRVQPVTWSGSIGVVHVSGLREPPSETSGSLPPKQEVKGSKYLYDRYPPMGVLGSTGGGIFLKESGKCLGLLSRGGPGMTLAVTTFAITEWAHGKKVVWAIDPTVPMPTEEELRKLPIEE